jgi:hypothetical protein
VWQRLIALKKLLKRTPEHRRFASAKPDISVSFQPEPGGLRAGNQWLDAWLLGSR